MKITIITAFLTLLFISCSSDDESTELVQEDPKTLPKRLNVLAPNQSGELVSVIEANFNYNPSKQINRIETSSFIGNENISFTYGSNGLPSKIDMLTALGTQTFDFEYNGTILSSYSVDGNQYPVLHNASNNSYSFQKNGETVSYFLNDSNDITRYMGVNPNGTPNLFQMEYENEKYGFLFNINLPLHLYIGIVSDIELFTILTHKPLIQISAYSNFEYTNTFNEDDFLIESIMNVDQYYNTLRYEYQEL